MKIFTSTETIVDHMVVGEHIHIGMIKYSMTITFNFRTNCTRRDFEKNNCNKRTDWLAHLILEITGRKEL